METAVSHALGGVALILTLVAAFAAGTRSFWFRLALFTLLAALVDGIGGLVLANTSELSDQAVAQDLLAWLCGRC